MGSQPNDSVGRPVEARWCAVTGSRGFMARHLVAALLRSGEWCVRVTDLAPTVMLGSGEIEGLLGDALRDGRAVYSSANVCNLDQLTKAFEGVDVVFHTAAADPSKNDLQLHYKVNVEGTKNVIDACKICKVKRLIYTSSSAVVFNGVHGLFNFPDAYAQTKAEAEKLVLKANGTNELLTCSIRPASIFGPGDILVPTLDCYGRKMFIIGDGQNCDDFVYVENVVHGHLCAEKTLSTQDGAKTSGGKAYFITNMEPINMWDFLYMVQEELGYKRSFKIRIPLLVIVPVSYVVEWGYKVLYHFGMRQPQMITAARIKYSTLNRTFSCNKAVEELGYRPVVSLKDGMKIAVYWYIRLRDADYLEQKSHVLDENSLFNCNTVRASGRGVGYQSSGGFKCVVGLAED
ncbi:3beta-hydroxysteroid-dehydrogenase/decarboxylase-like isoform X2 [Phragmites australis]|uniref:3beta-hydroxysteroid- dehydrogenase/decarboxylase-like isoform X2 n=1 Tax=Phragmites australis TaxID=29695 RepID=UPI002D766577|nr:3beta-hydroxysteroid-dehydrogenase/decarboxylase-like isoform X2 [Phragmites australis]